MRAVAHVDPRAAEPCDARAREVADLGSVPRPEGEHVEPVVAGAERVRLPAGEMDEAVSRPDLVGLLLLERDTRPGEHVEDLLLGRLPVQGRRPLARIDLDALNAYTHAPRSVAEVSPGAREVGELCAARLDVVPVNDAAARSHLRADPG